MVFCKLKKKAKLYPLAGRTYGLRDGLRL